MPWQLASTNLLISFDLGDPEGSPKPPTTNISSVAGNNTNDEGSRSDAGGIAVIVIASGKPRDSDF